MLFGQAGKKLDCLICPKTIKDVSDDSNRASAEAWCRWRFQAGLLVVEEIFLISCPVFGACYLTP